MSQIYEEEPDNVLIVGEEDDEGLFKTSDEKHDEWCKFRARSILQKCSPASAVIKDQEVLELAKDLSNCRYRPCWDGSHIEGRNTMHEYLTARHFIKQDKRDRLLSEFPNPATSTIYYAVLAFCGHPIDPDYSSMVIYQYNVSPGIWNLISTGSPVISAYDPNILRRLEFHQEDVQIRKELFVREVYSLSKDCEVRAKVSEIFGKAMDHGHCPARHDPISVDTYLVNVIYISMKGGIKTTRGRIIED